MEMSGTKASTNLSLSTANQCAPVNVDTTEAFKSLNPVGRTLI